MTRHSREQTVTNERVSCTLLAHFIWPCLHMSDDGRFNPSYVRIRHGHVVLAEIGHIATWGMQYPMATECGCPGLVSQLELGLSGLDGSRHVWSETGISQFIVPINL